MRTATPNEWPAAARWLFARTEPRDVLLEHLRIGRIEPSGLLVAIDQQRVRGAILVEHFPGRVAEVMPPTADTAELEKTLAREAVARLRSAEIQLAQMFLEPTQNSRAAPLEFCGFRRIAQTQQRTRLLLAREPIPTHGANLEFISFTEETREEFGKTLLATFEGGLDIPEAMTDRPASEILAGYAYSQSPPLPWRLVRTESGEAIGVLVLSAQGELVYFGVVPGARQKGFGRAMVREAIRIARNFGVKELSLTVDTRNIPALTLYDREGFRLGRLQDVYLWHAS